MGAGIAESIVRLKAEFAGAYKGNSHLYEALPLHPSGILPITQNNLDMLHRFAACNPIYTGSSEMRIMDMDCTVYEGDINDHWLDSIKHDTSYAPFYPTWMLSAYALASEAKRLGAIQAVDIGSGDGRIAYCCQMAGLKSHGIEIDGGLARLQEDIVKGTGVEFCTYAADATRFDYTTLKLDRPAVFIGGLPEVGEILADSVIEKISSIGLEGPIFVLTGTNAARRSGDASQWGWDALIKKFNLEVMTVATLPTRWTVDQPLDTPYVFAVPSVP